MTMFRTFAMACAATVALLATSGLSQAQELRPVGEVRFEPEPYALERDVITLREGQRRVRAFRIMADEGSADVRQLVVTYADGDQERVRVRQVLKEGERTALFRLEEPRPVRSVEISYVPKGPVTLVLLADARGAAPPPQQWEELACKSVGFLIDRDVINLNTTDRYRSLRLRSSGYDIELLEMAIRFGNGGREVYPVRTVIPTNGRTGPIDLRGDARRIRDIELIYRTRAIGTAKTRLCVDGMKATAADEEEDQ